MTTVKVSEIGKDLSPEALRDAYALAEIENSHLRHILLWTAEFVPPYRRHELAEKIKNKDTGVVEDQSEDNFVENRDFCKAVEELTDLYDRVIGVGKLPKDVSRSLILISKIREMLPKKHGPTIDSIAQLREWKK